MLWKCYTQYASKFGKLSSGHRTGKVPPFIPIPKKGNAKECLNYHTIALISHASKVMLKIRQAKFNSIWTKHFQMFKLDLEKAREPEIKLSTSVGSQKKQENSRKTSTIASLTRLSLWLCGSKQTGKFLKRWDYQTTWPASWEICMQVKKQQLEWDMEQQSGSKLGKKYVKAVYCQSDNLTSMKSTLSKMPGCMKHKLESRLLGEISTTSDIQMMPL